jgi:hypothetical protein
VSEHEHTEPEPDERADADKPEEATEAADLEADGDDE